MEVEPTGQRYHTANECPKPVASEAIYKCGLFSGANLRKKIWLCSHFLRWAPISFCSVISLCVYCYVKDGIFNTSTIKAIPVLLVDNFSYRLTVIN